MMQIVVLTGPMAGGKDEVTHILEEKGWIARRLSDPLKKEAIRRGYEHPTREILQNIGNEFREKEGVHVLAKILLESIQNEHPEGDVNVVINGARNPGEIEYLQKRGANIIGVTASPDVRFELWKLRQRDIDATEKNDLRTEFNRMEERDRGVGEGSCGQQVDACLEKADCIITNPGLLEGCHPQESLRLFRGIITRELQKQGVLEREISGKEIL